MRQAGKETLVKLRLSGFLTGGGSTAAAAGLTNCAPSPLPGRR